MRRGCHEGRPCRLHPEHHVQQDRSGRACGTPRARGRRGRRHDIEASSFERGRERLEIETSSSTRRIARRLIIANQDTDGFQEGFARRRATPLSRIGTVIARYSRPAMKRIWSDENRLACWLEVELAALDGWAEVGVVPREAARRSESMPCHRRPSAWPRSRAHATRRRSIRGRCRRGSRRAGPLAALRAHLLGRARHRAGAAGARRRPAHPGGTRKLLHRGRDARGEHRETAMVGCTTASTPS